MKVIKRVLEGKNYPCSLAKVLLFQSPSYSRCLNFLVSEIKNKKHSDAYYFTISDTGHDVFEVYSKDGKILHQHSPMSDLNDEFLGNDNPEFKEGDIVEVVLGDEVRLGFVTCPPPNTDYVKTKGLKLDLMDNCYLVDFSKNTNEHDHPRVYNLRKPSLPVSEEKVKELNEAFVEVKAGLS